MKFGKRNPVVGVVAGIAALLLGAAALAMAWQTHDKEKIGAAVAPILVALLTLPTNWRAMRAAQRAKAAEKSGTGMNAAEGAMQSIYNTTPGATPFVFDKGGSMEHSFVVGPIGGGMSTRTMLQPGDCPKCGQNGWLANGEDGALTVCENCGWDVDAKGYIEGRS